MILNDSYWMITGLLSHLSNGHQINPLSSPESHHSAVPRSRSALAEWLKLNGNSERMLAIGEPSQNNCNVEHPFSPFGLLPTMISCFIPCHIMPYNFGGQPDGSEISKCGTSSYDPSNGFILLWKGCSSLQTFQTANCKPASPSPLDIFGLNFGATLSRARFEAGCEMSSVHITPVLLSASKDRTSSNKIWPPNTYPVISFYLALFWQTWQNKVAQSTRMHSGHISSGRELPVWVASTRFWTETLRLLSINWQEQKNLLQSVCLLCPFFVEQPNRLKVWIPHRKFEPGNGVRKLGTQMLNRSWGKQVIAIVVSRKHFRNRSVQLDHEVLNVLSYSNPIIN